MISTNKDSHIQFDDRWILAQRGSKKTVNPLQPYAYLVEKERAQDGRIDDCITIFLTNRECPFRCLMCDLWENTTDHKVTDGAIPTQIQWALEKISPAPHIKLYNSGNFFDVLAIPEADIPAIARLMEPFKTVLVENHPRLINDRCLAFRDLLNPKLHIAMGLETVHTDVLMKLNKRMTLKDFEHATAFLTKNGISVRAFILLRPPFLNEEEGIIWAKRSIDFAFSNGVECCTVIPTRSGNGALDRLQKLRLYSQPGIKSLEEVLEYGIRLQYGRIFADLWDIEKLSHCKQCSAQRIQRMHLMNMTQKLTPPIHCTSCI